MPFRSIPKQEKTGSQCGLTAFRGVDWVQENILKQGAQNNESAAEQAKDEQISDFIRDQYKQKTGKDVPVQDKERF